MYGEAAWKREFIWLLDAWVALDGSLWWVVWLGECALKGEFIWLLGWAVWLVHLAWVALVGFLWLGGLIGWFGCVVWLGGLIGQFGLVVGWICWARFGFHTRFLPCFLCNHHHSSTFCWGSSLLKIWFGFDLWACLHFAFSISLYVLDCFVFHDVGDLSKRRIFCGFVDIKKMSLHTFCCV